MRCVTLVEREKESFQVTTKTVNRTRSGINEFQAAGPATKRPDDRTSNGSVAAQAADGSRRTVGAADERSRRCRRSSLSRTVVPCAADIVGINLAEGQVMVKRLLNV